MWWSAIIELVIQWPMVDWCGADEQNDRKSPRITKSRKSRYKNFYHPKSKIFKNSKLRKHLKNHLLRSIRSPCDDSQGFSSDSRCNSRTSRCFSGARQDLMQNRWFSKGFHDSGWFLKILLIGTTTSRSQRQVSTLFTNFASQKMFFNEMEEISTF